MKIWLLYFLYLKASTINNTRFKIMKSIKSTLMASIIVLSTCALQANASVIYDNGDLTNTGGASSGSNSGGGPYPRYAIADDFELSTGATTFNTVTWWGFYGLSPAVDDFGVIIMADDGSHSPSQADQLYNSGNVSVSREEVVGETAAGRQLYEYQLQTADITLAADTQFWLSIFDTSDTYWSWVETDSVNGDTGRFRNAGDSTWTAEGSTDYGFQLSYTEVPEPGSIALLGVGLLGLGASRFRGK